MAVFYKYEYRNKRKNIHPCWSKSSIIYLFAGVHWKTSVGWDTPMSPQFLPEEKTPHTRRFQSFSCSTFGIEDFCLSMGRGKGWFGAGVWKFTIFDSLQHSRRVVYCCIVVARIYSCNHRWTCFGSSGIILRGSRATEELDEGLGEAS